jgi:hypothetical protein
LPLKFFHANYYYLVLLPPSALAAGAGWQELQRRGLVGRKAAVAAIALSLAVSARLSIAPAFITPEEDRAVTTAAAAFREIAGPDEPVATLHGATIDLLYYCERRGWALNADDPQLEQRLEDARRRGAKHLVVAAVADAQRRSPWFATRSRTWTTVCEGEDWRVYRIE